MHIVLSSLTRRVAPLVSLALCLAAFSPAPARASGDTLATLHAFSATANGHNPDGANPVSAVTLDGQGHLYGTTNSGGTSGFGTLFEYDLATHTFTTLVDFTKSNGSRPQAAVTLDGQGHLYGTTAYGGGSNKGTVFAYDLSSGTLTTLVTFNGANGSDPTASVSLDGAGHLYGTTYAGGSKNDGTVFEYDLASSTLSTLVTFNGSNGASPLAGVTLDGQGHLYGTTDIGETLYKLNLATHTLTTLFTFTSSTGQAPVASVTLDGQGHLYGTCSIGGINGRGTVYKFNLATRSLTMLINFTGSNGEEFPRAPITLDAKGILYGTTAGGSAGIYGAVFKFNPATHYLTTFVTFKNRDFNGENPEAGVTLDGSGTLYGTTANGGSANGSGTVYELTPNP